MIKKIKYIFMYLFVRPYCYLKGMWDGYWFCKEWIYEHHELVTNMQNQGMTEGDILRTYALDAIQSRFHLSDEQISQLKQT